MSVAQVAVVLVVIAVAFLIYTEVNEK